ncbi:MAG TPA: DUF5990 family protein [Mycobacterium sp.]|nr:DUF5990 family protein [Mycobacterium sp.]
MRLQIVGRTLPGRNCEANGDFPGYANVHVGVQRKNTPGELLELHPGDATRATWTLDCTIDGTDVRGPYIQGRPGGRFVYLSWGSMQDDGQLTMFRRAKLMLEDVPADVLSSAAQTGLLIATVELTDAKGNPVCARVRPPQIRWTAGWAPGACTLPAKERPLRVAEFENFLGSVTRSRRPAPTRLDLVIPRNAEATGRDLAERETACCAFFDFEFEPAGTDVVMHVRVPPEHVAVLDALEALAASPAASC